MACLFVKDLIDPTTGFWRFNVLKLFLPEEDVSLISNLPLSSRSPLIG